MEVWSSAALGASCRSVDGEGGMEVWSAGGALQMRRGGMEVWSAGGALLA